MLPRLADVRAMAPRFAERAQRIYDEWDQDDDGVDIEFGTGGICDRIAAALQDVLAEAFADIRTCTGGGDNHANVVVCLAEGVYEIDIPYALYEHGGGYSWTKIPGVRFTAQDVTFFQLSPDPTKFRMYDENSLDDVEVMLDEEPTLDDLDYLTPYGVKS